MRGGRSFECVASTAALAVEQGADQVRIDLHNIRNFSENKKISVLVQRAADLRAGLLLEGVADHPSIVVEPSAIYQLVFQGRFEYLVNKFTGWK